MRYNTGEVFRGKWKNDKQEGIGKLDYVNGDVLRVSFIIIWGPGWKQLILCVNYFSDTRSD